MQALPPPSSRALPPSPVVPPAHGAVAALSPAGAPGAPEEAAEVQPAAAPAVPAPRHELPGGGRPGFLPRARQRPAVPDAVVFTAPCPACGADAWWSEEREDTRLRAAVDCPCG